LTESNVHLQKGNQRCIVITTLSPGTEEDAGRRYEGHHRVASNSDAISQKIRVKNDNYEPVSDVLSGENISSAGTATVKIKSAFRKKASPLHAENRACCHLSSYVCTTKSPECSMLNVCDHSFCCSGALRPPDTIVEASSLSPEGLQKMRRHILSITRRGLPARPETGAAANVENHSSIYRWGLSVHRQIKCDSKIIASLSAVDSGASIVSTVCEE
jgi:hypothetical protein